MKLDYKLYEAGAEAFEKKAGEKLARELGAYANAVKDLIEGEAQHSAEHALAEMLYLQQDGWLDGEKAKTIIAKVYAAATVYTLLRHKELLALTGGAELVADLGEQARKIQTELNTKGG